MGRLNKKLAKKIQKPSHVGLSNSATKALVDLKDTIKIQANVKESAPTPTADLISFTKHVEKVKNAGSDREMKKKNLKTVEKAGKIVKLGKKEKMKMRKGLLVKKLSDFANEKKEAKDKKKREKVVIVKDTKPLLENLEEIEEEIKKEDIDKLLKQKTGKKKISKHTQKIKKQKEQFMKDLEFLKAASQHPEYVANPLKTVTTHLQNSIGVTV